MFPPGETLLVSDEEGPVLIMVDCIGRIQFFGIFATFNS